VIKIKVKKLTKDAKLLCYAHSGDAGLDVFSCEDYELKPGERHAFSTGISYSIPSGYALLVWDKSGLAVKYGIKTIAGVNDSGFRGECKIVLLNLSQKSYKIKKGTKSPNFSCKKLKTRKLKK
jgi:dUTP pyrophosphatase